MDERPVTRYAKALDGVSIAYQVVGDGPVELAFRSPITIPIDLLWEEPSFVRFARRLGSFSRWILYEPRGMGASGGVYEDMSKRGTADPDLQAVLDSAGCQRVVLLGTTGSGPLAIAYAAAHPDRVAALVLINSFAHYGRGDDYPWGFSADALERFTAPAGQLWGIEVALEVLAPSRAGDEAFRSWCARGQRLGLAPETVVKMMRLAMLQDVRPLLPTLTMPTLVLHREGDRYIHVGAGRYLAEHIANAKYVELPGEDHWFFVGDTDALLDEVEEFLTGTHQTPEGDVLNATILFTDIVASTEQSARMGHRKWTALTHDHDALIRATLARRRGREVKTMGDGFLATFDATSRAVRTAMEIVAGAKNMGLDVRAGVHTGEVEFRSDDVAGLAVTIAKRICDLAGPEQVFVSRTVADISATSGMTFENRGEHELKGVPGTWRLYRVVS